MRFILRHWFGILMGFFLVIMGLYTTIILISPRYDIKKRGFIPCTEQLAQNLRQCGKNKFFCTFKAISTNNICDVKIIWQGLRQWSTGQQETPWSNYLFEPEVPEEDYPAWEDDIDMPLPIKTEKSHISSKQEEKIDDK